MKDAARELFLLAWSLIHQPTVRSELALPHFGACCCSLPCSSSTPPIYFTLLFILTRCSVETPVRQKAYRSQNDGKVGSILGIFLWGSSFAQQVYRKHNTHHPPRQLSINPDLTTLFPCVSEFVENRPRSHAVRVLTKPPLKPPFPSSHDHVSFFFYPPGLATQGLWFTIASPTLLNGQRTPTRLLGI